MAKNLRKQKLEQKEFGGDLPYETWMSLKSNQILWNQFYEACQLDQKLKIKQELKELNNFRQILRGFSGLDLFSILYYLRLNKHSFNRLEHVLIKPMLVSCIVFHFFQRDLGMSIISQKVPKTVKKQSKWQKNQPIILTSAKWSKFSKK